MTVAQLCGVADAGYVAKLTQESEKMAVAHRIASPEKSILLLITPGETGNAYK
jgi:hypothetical protein